MRLVRFLLGFLIVPGVLAVLAAFMFTCFFYPWWVMGAFVLVVSVGLGLEAAAEKW